MSCHVMSCHAWSCVTLACGNMATDSEKKKLIQDQSTVKRSVAIALLLFLFYGTIAVYLPLRQLQLPTLLDRVVFTLRWSMVSLLVVLLAL